MWGINVGMFVLGLVCAFGAIYGLVTARTYPDKLMVGILMFVIGFPAASVLLTFSIV